ncbi:MAG: NAD-dependent epimerase/dehydratase family protein [Candidatus Methanoperedens sp.]|nr:NAD-dependent epimerase/dehydratase family protein [Candidatus Methanoperedens sp.]
MEIALITGSAGLIGAESVRFFSEKGFKIIGIDNNMRRVFFGEEASTEWSRKKLESEIKNYVHYSEDIRDSTAMEAIFGRYNRDIKLIIHNAAQPSHDWAAKDPFTDFTVNANGTLVLLEMTRKYCPDAVFIFMSTNKVYGDTPNSLPLAELETRWEIDESHPFYKNGIDESMSVDQTKHSLFGASKLAADVIVQEYGRYFNMKTVCFRGGCLTGSGHSSTALHGFLAYLMKCIVTGQHYIIYGYKGKQVRDNIHSYDLVNAFWHYYQRPQKGEVYNIGGGRHSNCSMLEAIKMCEELAGKRLNYSYSQDNRIGDHIWYISDVGKFKSHYPGWDFKYSLKDILDEIFQNSNFTQNE